MVGDVILGAGPDRDASGPDRRGRFPASRWCDLNIADGKDLLRE